MERKKKAPKTSELNALIRKLRREVGKADPDVDLVLQLLDQFEQTPGDEKTKLRQKDQWLANSIIQLRRQGTLFLGRLVVTFQLIEVILAELKAQRGGS